MPVTVVVLAAGQGKRMHSALPKVLQPLAGRPLLEHVIAAARKLDPAAIHIVYGHGGDAVKAAFADQRTYVYGGKEVDRQTHLGFDLARVVNSPVVAANRGSADPKLLHAEAPGPPPCSSTNGSPAPTSAFASPAS